MVMSGTIMAAWKDAQNAYLAVRVEADDAVAGLPVAVEYIGATPLFNGDGSAKPFAQLQSECAAAVRAVRAREKVRPVAVPMSGTVSVE